VPEFTLSIETPEGTTTDEDVRARVEEALRTSSDVSGAATILHHGAGTISSTFQVEAPRLDVAQMIAIRVFADALRGAGLSGDSLWRIVAP
jgi:hypothetical protein